MHQIDEKQIIVEVRDVSFSYDGSEDVLKDITLAIHQGDYVGFVGPNGAGKTTLLRVMLNLLTPKRGMVRLFGQDIQDFKDWHKIGYVPQKAAHFDANFPASVYEVVFMGRYANKPLFQKTSRADKESVKDALLKVDMWEHRERLIGDLSGGSNSGCLSPEPLSINPTSFSWMSRQPAWTKRHRMVSMRSCKGSIRNWA